MKLTLFLLFILLLPTSGAAQGVQPLFFELSVAEPFRQELGDSGRLFVFFTQDGEVDPLTWGPLSSGLHVFARNLTNNQAKGTWQVGGFRGWDQWRSRADRLVEDPEQGWVLEPEKVLVTVPDGDYLLQMVWDQNAEETGLQAPGNLFSAKQKVKVVSGAKFKVVLSESFKWDELVVHPLVKEVVIKSDTLSAWWGRPMNVKASVLLPSGYEKNPGKAWPIRYNIAGYGGRYTRVNDLIGNEEFARWWMSDKAPQVITVFLDGAGPFGDPYQLDSENSGPYGYSLIRELMPLIEDRYRGTRAVDTRFVDGCSTGGWVSLALQLFHPELFNGCYSFSPDPVDFSHLLLVDIYNDKNAFLNEYGLPQPVMRDPGGRPRGTIKDWIQYENVLSSSGKYTGSGDQFGALAALFGSKGADGTPAQIFDPVNGKIDPAVAEQWRRCDLAHHVEEHWSSLGPQLPGKVFIWMGDMDSFYLERATRSFDAVIKRMTDPVSDAVIRFSPEKRHCEDYSHKAVLEMIGEKLGRSGK